MACRSSAIASSAATRTLTGRSASTSASSRSSATSSIGSTVCPIVLRPRSSSARPTGTDTYPLPAMDARGSLRPRWHAIAAPRESSPASAATTSCRPATCRSSCTSRSSSTTTAARTTRSTTTPVRRVGRGLDPKPPGCAILSSTRSIASRSRAGASSAFRRRRQALHGDAVRLEHGPARTARLAVSTASPSATRARSVRLLLRHLHDVSGRARYRSPPSRVRFLQRLALPARGHQPHLRRPARSARSVESVALSLHATLHSRRAWALPAGRADPRGGHVCDYARFALLRREDRRAYNVEKKAIRESILDVLEERYVPHLRSTSSLRDRRHPGDERALLLGARRATHTEPRSRRPTSESTASPRDARSRTSGW